MDLGGHDAVQNHTTRASNVGDRQYLQAGNLTDEGRIAAAIAATRAQSHEGRILGRGHIWLLCRLREDPHELPKDAMKLGFQMGELGTELGNQAGIECAELLLGRRLLKDQRDEVGEEVGLTTIEQLGEPALGRIIGHGAELVHLVADAIHHALFGRYIGATLVAEAGCERAIHVGAPGWWRATTTTTSIWSPTRATA